MKITKKQKEETIEHYNRMIDYAKTKESRDFISAIKMKEEIGENWNAEYCPLCAEYFDKKKEITGLHISEDFDLETHACYQCPLAQVSCCYTRDSAWHRVSMSGWAEDFITNATILLNIIANLPERKE